MLSLVLASMSNFALLAMEGAAKHAKDKSKEKVANEAQVAAKEQMEQNARRAAQEQAEIAEIKSRIDDLATRHKLSDEERNSIEQDFSQIWAKLGVSF